MKRGRLLPALAVVSIVVACGVEEAGPMSKTEDPVVSRPPANQMELLEERLPIATLSGSHGSITGEQGSWCWKAKHDDGALMAACADTFFLDPEDALEARPGEELTLSFDRDDDPERLPIHIHGWAGGHGKPLDVAVANPTSFKARPVPGAYWVHVGSWWSDGPGHLGGDVFSYVKIRVR
jgi:hypothetical protein